MKTALGKAEAAVYGFAAGVLVTFLAAGVATARADRSRARAEPADLRLWEGAIDRAYELGVSRGRLETALERAEGSGGAMTGGRYLRAALGPAAALDGRISAGMAPAGVVR